MRKKNLFKKLIATAGAMVMALTMMMPMGVSAADFPTGNGTLTITKYASTGSDLGWDETNTSQTDPQGTPIENVTFTIKNVGTIVQDTYTDDGTETTALLYNITDENVRNVLRSANVAPVSTNNSTYYYYSSTDIDAGLKSAYNTLHSSIENLVANGGMVQTTNGSGVATFNNLDQGLYLVVETAAPANVTQKSVPFFVSIPSIVNGTEEDGNTTWTTDVHAYPKNAVGTPTIDKGIQVPGTNEGTTKLAYQTNANIGDTITYEVPITAIVPADGLEQLYVTDTMTKGLTYTANSVVVYQMNTADDRDFADNKIVDSSNYSVDGPTPDTGAVAKTITIRFDSDYLETLRAGSTCFFRIVYNCTLNENAVLGQTGNSNKVELYYSNSTSTENVPNVPGTTEPKVFTYGIDLTKTGEKNTFLKDVRFTLTDGSDNPVKVKEDSTATYYIPGGDSNIVTTNDQGKISIRGLAPGTYKLTETKTNSGYVLLKDPITVVISQLSSETGVATATVNGDEVSMTPDELNGNSATAKVPLNVVNNRGFDLPQTGAAGTALFAIVGIVLAAVAGGLLFFLKRSPKRK